jgi:hypothetical protein
MPLTNLLVGLAWEALGLQVGSVVVGAALGAVRAATVKLWSQDWGRSFRQGTC